MKRESPNLVLTEQLRQFIKASATGKRRTASGKKISCGTISNYRYVLRLIIEFEKRNQLQLRIQLLHRASLRMMQREKNYWSRFFKQFSVFLYRDKKYYDHYVFNVFKIIKTFFNYLQHEKGYVTGNFHKSFKVPLQQSTPVVLSPDQLRFLITNEEFIHSLSPLLKKIRMIFIFGCTVGLRVSDLMKLRKSNLIKTDSGTLLTLFTEKTGSEVRIPLPEYALEIIDCNKRKAGNYLLPKFSIANLNIQIKKLIQKAGWDYPIPRNISYKGKMEEIKTDTGETWPFYKHITAHTMRRTAITTLLILGVSEHVVRKISGHAPGSKEFYKYVNIANDYLNQEVRNAYRKLVAFPAGFKSNLSRN